MDIKVRSKDGVVCYKISDVEYCLKQESSSFYLDEYVFTGCPSALNYDDEFIHEESLQKLMKYVHREHGIIMALSICDYVGKRMKKKRTYSTTHRIEIAYKSKYKCNMCKQLLRPTFEIDHIVELQDGGKDTYENCQALCNNCHAEKTRANVLRKHKRFKKVYGEKFKIMQENAFESFKYKKSKYF